MSAFNVCAQAANKMQQLLTDFIFGSGSNFLYKYEKSDIIVFSKAAARRASETVKS